MDIKDSKPARPSLFDSGPAPPDAQARRVPFEAGLAPPARPRNRWRTWPWILALGLAVAGLVGWMTLTREPTPPQLHVAGASAATTSDLSGPDASTAVLVDGVHPGDAGRALTEAGGPITGANADSSARQDAAGMAPQTDLASRFGLGSGASTPEKHAAAASRRVSTGPSRASARGGGEADLLAVLMANIREQPQARPGEAAPETMDALIAQLSKDSPVQKPSQTTAGETASSGEQSSANLQRQLRSCPAANTTAGIRCRQRLCAKHAGDPACPVQ